MNTPTISVIVPCYNQAQYLEECIESVCNQTYQNWECIIVNDGSPDNTREVAAICCKKDRRIKYYEKTNNGVSNARNYGIVRARGKYILPLDADDKIGAEYLEFAIKAFANDKNITVVISKGLCFGKSRLLKDPNPYSFSRLLTNNMFFNSAFFKKTDWERVNGYDKNLYAGLEDWEFWINLLKDGGEVVVIDSIQFFYRIKYVSRTTEINKSEIMRKEMTNYITKKHIDEYYKYVGNHILLSQKIEELEVIKNSNSYKVGKKLLYIPRILKNLIKKIQTHFTANT